MQDLYCALLNGATLYPWSLKSDGLTGIADWLIREGMTVYHSAATVFRYFVRHLSGGEEFPRLRIVRLGSEHVSWKDVELFRKHFSMDCVFVNALSSSETKTVRQYVLSADSPIPGMVPVGYPVEDMDVFLLDESGKVGFNQVGEIAVRSRYLSPGYWQKPELTATAYRADPNSSANRIFRTGEWGRVSADGCLEHLGRRDAQVKIRGYRVETNETELALLHHPAVDQVLVICRDSARDDKYLVAYIVLNGSPAPTVSELRMFLRWRIPEYMIPSAFVFLEDLPLAPNGKVDRNALPEPSRLRPALNVLFVTPQGPIEETLAKMWVEILGIERVGARDNFFDLGGNSLSAMQVVARMEKTFDVAVSLKTFFESPTIANSSRYLSSSLPPIETLKASPIVPAVRDRSCPLSFAQQRLWFLDQWESESPVYNICRAYRLMGRLNIAAMEESLNAVVQRHEMLRTTFLTCDGHPSQVIRATLRVPLSIIDLQGLPAAEREKIASRLANEEARRAFNLARGPLLRALLVQLADEEHMLVLTVHQIACDGWSMRILLAEFSQAYQAVSQNRSLSLPTLSVLYADFAIWQRELLSEKWIGPQISFWKETLGGALPVVALPTDNSRPARQSFRGSRIFFGLTKSLTEALKELSCQERVTLFMTLMAAFQTLLHRYTGQEDLVVGFPIANRTGAETRGLIGFFVNSLVLRTDLSENPTFKGLLSRVRAACLGAYANQDLPFEKLVDELRPERGTTRNPLFQVMFVFRIPESPGPVLQGFQSEPMDVDCGTAKFDLTLSLAERGDQLAGFFEYSTDLFDHSTIERMAGHFQILLEGIISDSDQPISNLPLLTEAEKHQLLVEWNDTAADYPKSTCIHELFEAQVERTPEAIAVQFEGKQLSYRELNSRANQLAHYLQGLGVGPEKLVGICVERSLEMVVGLLGILKAGGAYVPLDPGYPSERLEFMLRDAQVAVLLTQGKIVDDGRWRIDDGGPGETIEDGGWTRKDGQAEIIEDGRWRMEDRATQLSFVCIDREWDKIAQQSEEDLEKTATAQNLAYVIYTSGSTGTPKGVQIEHRSVINCLHSLGKRLGFTGRDVLLAVTPISFDIAGLELYQPLFGGGKLVVASREEVMDGRELLGRLTECSATVMQATPSTWRLLLDAGWKGAPAFKILCGGETLSRGLAERLLECGTLWNLYGPTETTIWSTVFKVEGGEGPVCIGRPVANTKVYILDSHLQPVPIGVHGEIYIGGDCLARGYLNRGELTTERFIRNPFSDDPDARLYRTGDRARYRPDGNIEFLGRLDNQVKIRGHRIELGEIESVLNQHPSVKEAVVVAFSDLKDETRETESGIGKLGKELVAYIVSYEEQLKISELRNFLKQKVPDYMIPSAFVFLNALPLTPNGKVDRSKLPPPDDSRPSLEQGFVAPRSEIEEMVAQVWREVLKVEKVGVHDNFFDLGGHSLLATRVVARLRKYFNIDLSLRKLFELPTVAGLAEHIDFLRRNQGGISVPPIVPVSRDRPLPLSFSQRRLWFLHKLDPGLTAYNIPARFMITGMLSIPTLEKALNEIIKRHEALRTRIIEIDGQPLQEILPNAVVELPVVNLSDVTDSLAEAMRLSADDARQPYNLSEGSLMRAKLLRLNEQKHVFILNFHHIVCDGSSLVIFYQELATLYGTFSDSKISTLPELPVQYADYAVWQHELLQGEALASQLVYWKQQLGSGLTTLNLPTDYERPTVQTYRGSRLTKTLSEELTQGLKDLSRRQGVTLFMTLLATLDLLLSRYTGQDDIIVGSTIAGRNRPETDGLIGFFINALALRTDLSGNPTFLDLLKRVREVCLDAYTHQDLPFERVVEEINPERDLSRNPLFQVLFNMVDISERILELAGCQIVKLPTSEPEAKFDIILHAPEVDGQLELAIVYNADLFTESRISSLLDQFSDLLAQVVENSGLRIDQYSLVPLAAREVLPDPNHSLDDTWEGPIYKLFSRQANRVPNCRAVVDPNESWTYRELDRQSNQLANYLITRGIQPRDLVAIYAHRSAPLVLALLSVLKAGSAFVILDPAYPSQRLIDYLKIAQPKGWLQMAPAGELPQELSRFLDSLEIRCRSMLPRTKNDITDTFSRYPENETGVPVDADDPAYIAFTSGSTGQPKGVLCRHGPMTHFLPWQEKEFDLRPTDRFCLLSGLGYNHLHRDVFTPLALGVTLYVPPGEIVRDPVRLTEWLRENSISVLHLTPALGQLLLTAGLQPLPAVRRIFFGGDVLTCGEVAHIRELAPNAIIGSFYGATETQRAVGYYEIPLDSAWKDTEANRPIPLGRGIKDVQLLLLNKTGKLAGVGELGELYVRSPHLAESYVGDEALTNERFLGNPFSSDPTDRLYRTGELGRFLPDGNVEWAGRNDRCVNIRGFRVELDEVESVLKQHPAIQNAAVVLQDYEISSSENLKPETRHPKPAKRLVAYVVAEEEQHSLSDLLHSYISGRLPDYMIPAHFMLLEQLPLNPNGKVDYKALPLWEQSPTGQTDSVVAPRNDLEAKLCKIFSEVLGVQQVGVNDNFFRLGGHSLLAAQVAARVKERFGVGLELRTFLESPTIAALAKHIEIRIKAADATSADDTDREEIEL
jgi:amino acid adenylation domain-containing protein